MAKTKKQPTFNWRTLSQLYKEFKPFYWRQRRAFGVVFLSVLLNNVTTLLNPWPLKLILDYIILDAPLPAEASLVTNLVGTSTMTLLLVLVLAIPVLAFLDTTTAYWQTYYLAAAGHKIIADIREYVFARLQHLSLLFHKASQAGDLVYRLTSDVKELRVVLVELPLDFAKRILTVSSIIAVMVVLEWRLAAVAAAIIPPIFLYAFRFGKSVNKASKTRKKKEGEVASIVAENIASMALVQAYGQEASEQDRFDTQNQASVEAGVSALRLSKLFKRVSDLLVILGTVAVVYLGARLVLAGNILPGTLVVFVSYLRKLYSPIEKTAEDLVQIAEAQAAAERILELVENDQVVEDAPDAKPVPATVRGRIEFDRVSFAYEPEKGVLQDLSFVVQPGQQVALVGHSGAGKSTLLGLLLRFYEPQQGKIYLDDLDISQFQLASLRQQITIVFQEAVLLRKTVRENILMGRPTATDEEVVAAAKKAQAHDFIMALPDGYETLVEERGENFSGGQQQRLSIARAILRDAPIVVLDEPATGLDARSETAVHAALAELTAGKTSFIIAHHFQTIRNAHKILVLEQGQPAQFGSHNTLIQTSPHYRKLYEIQFGAQSDKRQEIMSTPILTDPFANPFPHTATFELHGATLHLSSNSPGLADYLQEHAQSMVTKPAANPHIAVRVLWVEKGSYNPQTHSFANLDQLDRVGRRILSSDEQLVWLDTLLVPGLQLRFGLCGEKLTMDAIYCFDPGRKESADDYRIKKYFSLAKYFVYFPLAWYLEHFHSLYMLHASAVMVNGTAVVIAGVGGVGKTTTSMALMRQEGAKLLSENLIFYDDGKVYSCYEPLRADDDSMALMGFTNGRFRPGQILPRVKDKNVYHLRRTQMADAAPVEALFIPKFGQETAVTRLKTDLVVEQLLAINTQTREVNAYYQFAATLGLHWPKGDRGELRILQLAELLHNVPTYELSIDPRRGVDPVLQLIQQHTYQKEAVGD